MGKSRVQTNVYQNLAFRDPVRIIQTQNPHRYPRFRCERTNGRTIPYLRAWIEQGNADGGLPPAAEGNIHSDRQRVLRLVGVDRPAHPMALRLLLHLSRNLCLEHNHDMFNTLDLIELLLLGFPSHPGSIQRQQTL